MKNVLITGATSVIGARLLEVLSRREGVESIRALGRGGSAPAPGAPAGAPTNGSSRTTAAVRWDSADARAPRLGLDEAAYNEICSDVDTVFHCAERTALDHDIEAARAENVEPVRVLVELLERAPGARLVHLSTAWVTGTKRGLFTEFDLDYVSGFYNAYEQSKHEAERLLASSPIAGRVTVARRSLALDAAGRGTPARGGVLEDVVRALSSSRLVMVSGDPEARVDVVPVDYVAEAMATLAALPGAAGRTCHLVAGWPRSWTLRALLSALSSRCGSARIRFLPSMLASPLRPLSSLSSGRVSALPGRIAALQPYLRQRCVFDDFMARRLLEPAGVTCPPPDAYIGRALEALGRASAGAGPAPS